MKCNPTYVLLLVDVGFPCVNPTYGVIKPRRHEGHEGRKKKISNFRLRIEYYRYNPLVKLKHYIDLCTYKEFKYLIFGF